MRDETKAALLRRDLDGVLNKWRRLPQATPKGGWIRVLREALCMTADELAARMGMSQTNVSALEASEAKGKIQLDSLRRAAKALECDLVYALVPKKPLETILERRRRGLAVLDLSSVLCGKPPSGYRDLITAYGQRIKRNRLWREGKGRGAKVAATSPEAGASVTRVEEAPAPMPLVQEGGKIDLANASIEELIGIIMGK
jgi:predicted DNA-binding mobile mystery protein A